MRIRESHGLAERWKASRLPIVAFQKQKPLVALARVLLGRSSELLSTGSAEEPKFGMVSSALQYLDLSINQFSTLPAEVGQLSALRELHLSWNQLSTLLAELGQLSALQYLYQFHNHLGTLPAELGQLASRCILDGKVRRTR